jgi:hypothetical protein
MGKTQNACNLNSFWTTGLIHIALAFYPPQNRFSLLSFYDRDMLPGVPRDLDSKI